MKREGLKAVYPGSFNPVHPGHLHVIAEATKIFDKVIVLVANNPGKEYKVPARERAQLIEKLISDYKWADSVIVAISDGLLVNYCKKRNIHFVIRGIRNGEDFQNEQSQLEYNKILGRDAPQLSYVYLASPYPHFSSTAVRQFIRVANDVKDVRELYYMSWFCRSSKECAETLWRLYHEC